MCQNILSSFYTNNDSSYCKSWGQLNTYLCENFNLRYGLQLVNKETWEMFFTLMKNFLHYQM